MAVIRAFRHEVKGHGTRHATDVDCLYFDFLDTGGSTILQLSTLGSDHRQSQPKVSQTFQIGAQGAAELRRILDQTFPGLRPAGEGDGAPHREAPVPVRVDSGDPVDRFVARAGLTAVDDVKLAGSAARRRVVARDDRPYVGGSWYVVDFTNLPAPRYADVDCDLASVPGTFQRVAVIVNEISEDLEQHLVRSHADVVRVADLDQPTSPVAPEPRDLSGRGVTPDLAHAAAAQPASGFSWVEEVLSSEIYRAQQTLAGRATVDTGIVRDVVNAVARLGSSGPIATVERHAGLRSGELRAILPLLRRLLNVDGYEALTLDDGILAIDESLLRQQFGVAEPALTEGDRL